MTFLGHHLKYTCNMFEKKNVFYFWDEMWNNSLETINKDKKTTEEDKLDDEKT